MKHQLPKLSLATTATLKDVIEHGLEQAKDCDAEGFDYKVGEIDGGEIIVSFKPTKSCFDSIEIDGANGFGYTLVTETK